MEPAKTDNQGNKIEINLNKQVPKGYTLSSTTNYLPWNISDWYYSPLCTSL